MINFINKIPVFSDGDSFTDSLKSQTKNILIYTVAKVGANEIGRSYHGTATTLTDSNGNPLTNLDGTVMTTPQISKLTQLTLHAALGCAVGAATNTSCGSGAVAGVVGEQMAEISYSNGLGRETSIQVANLVGGIAAGTYGNLTNQSDEDNAKNVWEGSRIGKNVAENNALIAQAHKVQINKDLETDSYHFSWLVIPDDQDMWKENIEFKNNKTADGKVYMTIGGGPDSPFTDFITELGLPNLHGGINRQPYDTDLKIKTFTVQINASLIEDENSKIQQLLDLNKNFENNPNKLNYWFFPKKEDNFYNSNSYFTGIGQAAGLPIPRINIKAPGYDKPVPPSYFINSNQQGI